jgi:hypothetical protein
MDRITRRHLMLSGTTLAGAAFVQTRTRAASPQTFLEAKWTEKTLDGVRMKLRTYNGQVPGPLIKARPGETLRIRMKNSLPPTSMKGWDHNHNVPHMFNTTNLHLHGLDIAPHLFEPLGTLDPTARMISIESGKQLDYAFEIPEDRPRHSILIEDIRRQGARIRLIGDGDLSAGIAVAVRGTGVHAVIGTGGAPEGVITGAALRCLHGEMVARLVVDTPELKERVAGMGIKDPGRIYTAGDLAPGNQITFVACGVTEGALLRGVRFFGEGHRTHTLVMTSHPNSVRFIDTVHLSQKPGPRGVRLY